MNILILGGTGRTGKLLVQESLSAGYQVHMLVRDLTNIPFEARQPNLKLFEGTPENINDLEKALRGCEYVINTLNISRNSDFPWSKLRTPPTLLSNSVRNIMDLSSFLPIKKVVICSAWGVAESRDHIPFWFKWLIAYSNISAAYIDHQRQEDVLKSSTLDWVIVRPVGLTNSTKKQQIKVSFNNAPKPSLTINRISVANYLLGALFNKDLSGKIPVISAR
ncbi:MAG: NAD(P)H-binding protein [Bacteroidota bacterium]